MIKITQEKQDTVLKRAINLTVLQYSVSYIIGHPVHVQYDWVILLNIRPSDQTTPLYLSNIRPHTSRPWTSLYINSSIQADYKLDKDTNKTSFFR